MAVADVQPTNSSETEHSTKRVFIRAEQEDIISITEILSRYNKSHVPKSFTVIKRELTYFGPKLRVEDYSGKEQFLLTIPGPKSEAVLWYQSDSEWETIAQVSLDFDDSYPQYDICLHCNEPLSTVEHRRRSVIGACSNS